MTWKICPHPPKLNQVPLSEILAPVADIINDSSQNHPLTFQDLQEFIKQCSKTKDAPVIARDYTNDISGLINLLVQCHAVIKDRNVKSRLTRIKKALENALQS